MKSDKKFKLTEDYALIGTMMTAVVQERQELEGGEIAVKEFIENMGHLIGGVLGATPFTDEELKAEVYPDLVVAIDNGRYSFRKYLHDKGEVFP